MKNMNLQIRSMFDAEPASAELSSSQKRWAKRPFNQWNTQSSHAPHGSAWHSRNERLTTHTRAQEELLRKNQRQFNQAREGCQNPQKVRQPKKRSLSPLSSPPPLPLPHSPHADKTNHPTALKHSVGKRHRRCILKPIHVRGFDQTDIP